MKKVIIGGVLLMSVALLPRTAHAGFFLDFINWLFSPRHQQTEVKTQVATIDPVSVSNVFAKLGTPVTNADIVVSQPVTFGFTVSTQDKTIYISKNTNTALATSTQNLDVFSSSLITVEASPAENEGDTSEYFVIPARSSRTFQYSGIINDPEDGGAVYRIMRISTIFYGFDPSGLQDNFINKGLSGLQVSTVTGTDSESSTNMETGTNSNGASASNRPQLLSFSMLSGALGDQIANTNGIITYKFSINFSAKAGNKDMLIYKEPGNPLRFGVNGKISSYNPTLITASPAQLIGDTDKAYIIPAGTVRDFYVEGTVSGKAGLGILTLKQLDYFQKTNSHSETPGHFNLPNPVSIRVIFGSSSYSSGGGGGGGGSSSGSSGSSGRSTTIQVPISVSSPVGGTYNVGDSVGIKWSGNYNGYNLYLSGGGHAEGYTKMIGSTIAGTKNLSYTTIGADVPVSGYSWSILVCPKGEPTSSSLCGLSQAFSIHGVTPSSYPTPISSPAIPVNQTDPVNNHPVYTPSNSPSPTAIPTPYSSIRVLSPNGSESYNAGDSLTVRWTANIVSGEGINLSLRNQNSATPPGGQIVSLVSNTGTYQWTIPSTLIVGSYKIYASVSGASGTVTAQDLSDNYFTINPAVIPSSITITSPNGSEVYHPGNTVNIKWSANISSAESISLSLKDTNGAMPSAGLINVSVPNTGTYSWQIPANIVLGNYKVYASVYNTSGSGETAQDLSDNYFTISLASSTPTPAAVGETSGHSYFANVLYSLGDLVDAVSGY